MWKPPHNWTVSYSPVYGRRFTVTREALADGVDIREYFYKIDAELEKVKQLALLDDVVDQVVKDFRRLRWER